MKYKLITKVLIILLGFIDNSATAQRPDSLKNWRIHKLVDGEALEAKEDSLPFIPSRLLSSNFISELKNFEPIKTDSAVFVMSAYLLSYEDDKGKMRKVLASGGGNFIYLGHQRKFYSTHEENRRNWLEMLTDEYGPLRDN